MKEWLFLTLVGVLVNGKGDNLPLVVSTWYEHNFHYGNQAAWEALMGGSGRVGAVVAGASRCEALQCDGTVGYGGSPDESGETTLDALLMDGVGQRMGAVADLRRVPNASRVAWAVMNHTKHSILAGESATVFAQEMGFTMRNLSTINSVQTYKSWKSKNCQPNFWTNVSPNPNTSCGPYRPLEPRVQRLQSEEEFGFAVPGNHDTIGLVVVDSDANVAVGTSTNGANHKIHGCTLTLSPGIRLGSIMGCRCLVPSFCKD